jgi:hypothetical protein
VSKVIAPKTSPAKRAEGDHEVVEGALPSHGPNAPSDPSGHLPRTLPLGGGSSVP